MLLENEVHKISFFEMIAWREMLCEDPLTVLQEYSTRYDAGELQLRLCSNNQHLHLFFARSLFPRHETGGLSGTWAFANLSFR